MYIYFRACLFAFEQMALSVGLMLARAPPVYVLFSVHLLEECAASFECLAVVRVSLQFVAIAFIPFDLIIKHCTMNAQLSL